MVAEVGKIVGMVAEKDGQCTIDLLQLLLHEEISRMAQGTVRTRFLVDGGFEGEIRVDIKDIRVKGDRQRLVIEVDGHNGGFVVEIVKS